MDRIVWTSNLTVGIDLIDEQHRMLIEKIADLADAVDMQQGVDKILKTLDFMSDYANFHFSTEEKHMLEQGYPERDSHMDQHARFSQMISDLENDFREEGATPELSEAIHTFLMNWLIDHIISIDLKFGEFLEGKGFTG